MFATVRLHRLLPIAAALALAACAQTSQMVDAPMKAMKGTPTLYERLGGQPAINAVVDDFVANVAADQRINRFFANANVPRLKRLLAEQICAGAGGPCTYTGRDMKMTHAGMSVGDQDFNALVEDLIKSLDKYKVPTKEQQELLALLGPMRKDIVTR
jgi:hemoglobin